jgi:hypothetical protein
LVGWLVGCHIRFQEWTFLQITKELVDTVEMSGQNAKEQD